MPDRGDWLSDALGRRLPHGSWPPDRSAPAGLELVRQFLNTRNPHTGADLFGTSAGVRDWLHERGLPHGRIGDPELRTLRRLRDTVHALTIANGDGTDDGAAWAALDRIARQHPATVSFAPPGWMAPATRVEPLVVAVLAEISAARTNGTWSRLKACHEGTCRWVIFDRSKNQSAGWCSAGTCGGKARAKAYRARRREAGRV